MEPGDVGRGNECRIYIPGSKTCRSSCSSCVSVTTQQVPKRRVKVEYHLPPVVDRSLCSFRSQMSHLCSSSPGWTTRAASRASLCSGQRGDGVFTAVRGCVHLQPHTRRQNTHTCSLTHSLSFLPKFPSIYTAESRTPGGFCTKVEFINPG